MDGYNKIRHTLKDVEMDIAGSETLMCIKNISH